MQKSQQSELPTCRVRHILERGIHYRLYHVLQGTESRRDNRISYANVYDVDNLRAAYERLHRTVSPGIDGRAQTELTERGLERLSEELRRHRYAPKPAQRITLPTPEGGRPLSIASTIDKVVQTAMLQVLEAAFEPTFRDSSHGFRVGRNCHTCLKVLRSSWIGISWLVQIDLQKIWTKLHHEILLELMAPVLYSKSMEDLMRKLLNAGYVDIYNLTDRTQYNIELVMGSIISPLCNNILLHELDCYVEDELIPMFGAGAMSSSEDKGAKKLKYLRFADNILFGLKGSKQDGIAIREAVKTFLQQKLKFDINESTSPVLNAHTDMTKFLGALIQYGWRATIAECYRIHFWMSPVVAPRGRCGLKVIQACCLKHYKLHVTKIMQIRVCWNFRKSSRGSLTTQAFAALAFKFLSHGRCLMFWTASSHQATWYIQWCVQEYSHRLDMSSSGTWGPAKWIAMVEIVGWRTSEHW